MLMVTFLSGWSGVAQAATPGGTWGPRVGLTSPAFAPSGDVIYSLRDGGDGSVVLTASSSAFSLHKRVQADGQTEVVIQRGDDKVTLQTTASWISVARGQRSVKLQLGVASDEEFVRAKSLLASSIAVQAFRALVTALEESGADGPERMGVRLTGAVLAQLDGDLGAVRRLSRELRLKFAGPERRVARQTDCWSIYQAGVAKAAADYEQCLNPFSYWNPMRQACSFVWVLQVEGLWFAYLSCSSFPFPR
jgi:hypothetical protein